MRTMFLKSNERSEVEQNGAKRVRGLVLALSLRKEVEEQPVFLLRYARSCKQTVCLKETAKFILR